MQPRALAEAGSSQDPQTLPVGIYPAALAQRRLWFLDQLQGPTSAYNVHVGLWLYGPLDLKALQASLQIVVDRHESLRTSFTLTRNGLIQLVLPSSPVALPFTDFSAASDPYPQVYELARQEVGLPFDLSQGPLFRARMMRIAAEEHVFLCTMHHTITDAWSVQVLVKELSALYDGFVSGATPTLPELPVQYGDYSEWQHQALATELFQKELAYWTDRLKGAAPVLDLPQAAARPSEQTLAGTTRTFSVPAELMASIKSLATSQQATVFMLLLAAFKVLLYRYSGQSDLLVGVPVAGRSQIETEGLIGFFVDTLVLRDDLSGNPRFRELLAEVRETTLGAFANGDVPFDKIVEVVQPQRDLRYNPIFQVMFSVIKAAIRSHSFGNTTAYPYVVYPDTSIFDLSTAFVEDSDGNWWLQFDFNTGLFREESIARMCEDYISLLRGIVANSEARIDALPIASLPESVAPPQAKPKHTAEGKKPTTSSWSSFGRTQPIPGYEVEEALLVDIWKEVLGVPQIGLRDNFFDLGGHSLLAARLVREVQNATGRKIPVSAIFKAPTVETLATLIKDDISLAPEPVCMKLREGAKRIPFFLIAAPGVDSIGFGLLARTLAEEQPVYKLQGPGPLVADRPFEKDELHRLAQEYISVMRGVQPHGTFCLGGMCDGVQIAQRMIVELESQGEVVSLFAIFDTWVLENSQDRRLWAVDYYLTRLRSFHRLPSKQKLATMKRAFKRQLKRHRNAETDWNRAYWPGEDFQPPRFRAPILLFKRPRQPYFYIRDPQMGWGTRSMSGVEVCEIDCGHFDFLRPPYVRLIGEKLQARLREINEYRQATQLAV
jgi:thioesterase domain-containing protein/acyl carrier protein